MNTEDLGNSKILNLLFKPAGMLMGSRVRRWLMNPMKTLQGAGIQPGQTVLEVGCGTGFFTIPAAQLIGDQGCLVAMDALSDFTKQVSANETEFTITGDVKWSAINSPFKDTDIQLIEGFQSPKFVVISSKN